MDLEYDGLYLDVFPSYSRLFQNHTRTKFINKK